MNQRLRSTLVVGGLWLATQQPATTAETPVPHTTADAFLAQHGFQWRVVGDPVTGEPRFIYGDRIATGANPQDDGSLESIARLLVDTNPELFGMAAHDLELIGVHHLKLAAIGSSDKVAVEFRQVVGGVPVFNGTVTILFEQSGGAVLAIDIGSVSFAADVDLTPAASSAAVLPAAQVAYAAKLGVSPTQIGTIDAVIVGPGAYYGPKSPLNDMGPTLAYAIDMRTPGALGSHGAPAMARVLISAEGDHTVFEVAPTSHAIDGTIRTMVNIGPEPNTATNQESTPLRHAFVRDGSQGGPLVATTGGDGKYGVAQTGPLALFVEYEGPYCRTDDASGGEYFASVSGATGSNADILLNPTLSEFDTAEAAAYHHVLSFREWIHSVNPTDGTMDFQVLANVNKNDLLCNAYYDGTSINLERAGAGCTNTSYMDVVQHEEGHWANARYIGGGITSAFHEGNADNFAYYINDDPCLTAFSGSGCLRNANQTTVKKCPVDGDETCNGGEGHKEGQALASAVFEVRERLDAALGNVAGGAAANALFMAWMRSFNDRQILDVIRDHWLALDDDNGSLVDLTPHFAAIEGGFVAYGWHVFPDLAVTMLGAPLDNAEVGHLQPTTVVAKITSLVGAPVTAQVFHATSGSAFAAVTMTATGNPDEYAATLPGVASPDTVRWYLRATSGSGSVALLPPSAPETSRVYHSGKLVVLAQWNFDGAGDDGWTHVNLSGSSGDQWERANPSFSLEASDPHAAISPARIWGTDLSVSGFDGKYEPSSAGELRSPTINLSGAAKVFLQYQRCLAVENALSDQAQIRVNGALVFQNAAASHTLDKGFALHTLDISPQAANHASTQVSWRITADSSLEFGGWNIDDVMLYRVDPAPGGFFATYGTSCAGATGKAALLSGSGAPTPGGTISIDVTNGKPNAAGLLVVGPTKVSLALAGGCSLLVGGMGNLFPVALNASGAFAAPGQIPAGTALGDTYWQFVSADTVAPGLPVAFSNGLHMHLQ